MDELEYGRQMAEVRSDIDSIDNSLISLLIERMKCSERVAEIKRQAEMPVFDPKREQSILDRIRNSDEDFGDSLAAVFSSIMSVSKARQHLKLAAGKNIRELEKTAARKLDTNAKRAICQGVEGAYSHRAAKMWFESGIEFVKSFKDVFSALNDERADYGIIPVENSDAGSVTEAIDLIMKYRLYIVGAAVITIGHCLAAREDSGEIKEVFSHIQALKQCSDYIESHGLKEHEYINTAAAAEYVAESKEKGIAAICSIEAAQRLGLKILDCNIQNAKNNATRFLLISKTAVFAHDADKISLCFSLPHTTGSLYNILENFAVHGLNLTKIESRPIPESKFEYDFFLDFTGNIHDKNTLELISALNDELPRFSFLGNYREL